MNVLNSHSLFPFIYEKKKKEKYFAVNTTNGIIIHNKQGFGFDRVTVFLLDYMCSGFAPLFIFSSTP